MAKAAHSDLLTDANLERVISLLEAEKPITKKAACEILGIAYNTTRLGELIQKYKDKRQHKLAMYAKKRGVPADAVEVTDIVKSYLQNTSITEIAASNYRTTDFIKKVLTKHGVTIRDVESNYWNPPMIDDSALKRVYQVEERCYAVRYKSLAKVRSCSVNKDGDEVYLLWLESEDQQQFAYQPWWELSSLSHLKLNGVNI